jgi:putative peptidoglycan lipid II flippase
VSNAAVIAYLIFFNKYFGIYGLAAAMLIGWSLQVFVQIPALIKKKFRYTFTLNFKNEGLKDVFTLALPVLVSSWLQPVCVLVNTIFASYLQAGSVAALELANRLYIIIVGVFVFAITHYIFPSLSKMSGGGDHTGFAEVMNKSLRAMLAIVAPIMAGMMLLSTEIITAVYFRGQFDSSSVALTATALFFYSIGMVCYGTNEILNTCFYAGKDGKTPMFASAFGILSAVALAFVFTKAIPMGTGGLALGASLSSAVVSCVLIYQTHKKTSALLTKELLIFVLKIAACTAVMTIAAAVARHIARPYGVWVSLTASALAGAVVYCPLLAVCKAGLNIPFPRGSKETKGAKK